LLKNQKLFGLFEKNKYFDFGFGFGFGFVDEKNV